MQKVINFNNVYKKFNKTIALNNVNFSIDRLDFTALIGNNGAGKTTIINAICNLIEINSGQINIFGKELNPKYVSYKGNMGFVLSKPFYIEQFTVKEYLEFVCKFQQVPKMEIRKRITNILDYLDLKDYGQKIIKNHSSGNQMKVSLAAALIHNPEVLIFDEPFINLDIQTIDKIMSILEGFNGKKTLFITSHYLDLVVDLCDRFLILNNGKIEIELNKKDFNNIEPLKLRVKEILGSDDEIKNIEWLI